MESNFINNTSMVFSLCLRSLLEHQKNSKRPFQKHFHNSLLTRYLRDYMEGKKRMTLILTVKPGEDDYSDSSFLLRQASPYMRIKFNNVEEPHNAPRQKRYNFPLAKFEHPKRRKCTGASLTFPVDETKGGKAGCPASEKESPPSSLSSDVPELSSTLSEVALLDKFHRMKRSNQVLQNFSKALWNVLKQYKKKLEVSENDAENLRRKLNEEEARVLEVMKQLEDLKSPHYSCCSHFLNPVASHSKLEVESELCVTALPPKLEAENEPENFASIHANELSEVAHEEKCIANSRPKEILCDEDLSVTGVLDPIASSSLSHVAMRDDLHMLGSPVELALSRLAEKASDLKANYGSQGNHECQDLRGQKDMTIMEMSIITEVNSSTCHSAEKQRTSTLEMPFSEASASVVEDLGRPSRCEAIKLPKKQNSVSSTKVSNSQRPRRRLLPASVMLLKELNGFDMEVENPKGSKCSEGPEMTQQRGGSQGTRKLFSLLKSNLQ